jgi:hypothetical protein
MDLENGISKASSSSLPRDAVKKDEFPSRGSKIFDEDVRRAVETKMLLLDALTACPNFDSPVPNVEYRAHVSRTTHSFDPDTFLEDLLSLCERTRLTESMSKLIHSSGIQDIKTPLCRLAFHLWSLTCPPRAELHELRNKIDELAWENLATSTQGALKKVSIFLDHPLVEGFLQYRTSGESSDASVEVPKSLTRNQIKQLELPSGIRSSMTAELQSKRVSPSHAYRLSILAQYAQDPEVARAVSDLAELLPGAHADLRSMNEAFRISLFPLHSH